ADLSALPIDPKAMRLDELKLSGKAAAQVKASGSLRDWKNGTAEASLSSNKLGIKDILFEQVKFNAGYTEHKLNASLGSNTYGGSITARADADLSRDEFTYKASAAVKTVDIGALIKESKIIPQHYEGIVTADAEFSGKGPSPTALTGTARLDLTDGHISDFGLIQSISGLLGIELLINEAHGSFNAHDGFIYTEDTRLTGPAANIGIRGCAEFSQALDLTGRVTLTPDGALKINTGVRDNVFVYENDEYYTEMKIGGTLSAPKPAYTDFIKNWFKKKGTEILLKQIIGKEETGGQQPSQESSPAPTVEEQVIEGLFKIFTK
ncbi:MAG: AsmA-like C-terminal region-containing protein, partial [Victivallales bacterium]|nr:AsmA-like C-terminal region-containing protein [Victivallales bacterium]